MPVYFRKPVTFMNEEIELVIPSWVQDHRSFRRWARSPAYPARGKVSYLDGVVWVDLSMEKVRHNLLKTVVAVVLTGLAMAKKSGRFFGDRMMLTNAAVRLSTEPDGMFVTFNSLEEGRVLLKEGEESLEVEGSPNMALEVLSKHSVKKDTVELMHLYWAAGIEEYWVIDSRKEDPPLTIYAHTAEGYQAVRRQNGWVKSKVFGQSFCLRREEGRGGLPDFILEWK